MDLRISQATTLKMNRHSLSTKKETNGKVPASIAIIISNRASNKQKTGVKIISKRIKTVIFMRTIEVVGKNKKTKRTNNISQVHGNDRKAANIQISQASILTTQRTAERDNSNTKKNKLTGIDNIMRSTEEIEQHT